MECPYSILKAWHHHAWRRSVIAESLGRAPISSLSYGKISCYLTWLRPKTTSMPVTKNQRICFILKFTCKAPWDQSNHCHDLGRQGYMREANLFSNFSDFFFMLVETVSDKMLKLLKLFLCHHKATLINYDYRTCYFYYYMCLILLFMMYMFLWLPSTCWYMYMLV